MKLSSLIAATLVLSVSLLCSQSYAQSKNIASDKQKQAALDKQRAHQAELQKKYNAMTPEQQAEAKRKAAEYKRTGNKGQVTRGSNTTPTSKPAQTRVNSKKPVPVNAKRTTTPVNTQAKPILMDANGKPLNKVTPATTGKSEASPAKTAVPVKSTVTPVKKDVQKTAVLKTNAVQVKTPPSETKKK